ncbi:hypothetical protein ACISI0_005179 [Escherichia coli]|nr:hypothetical protein [Escherichia coli]EJX0112526.1 hypothetical protein [Escherichia coli]ELU5085361.1 hypothetical protein [Escherichia coli]
MQIIIMTRDRYLEYGLMCMLNGYRLTTGRELFDAGKRRLPLPEDSYVILCDRNLLYVLWASFSCHSCFLCEMPDRYQAGHPLWGVAVRTYGKTTDPYRDGGGLWGCFP